MGRTPELSATTGSAAAADRGFRPLPRLLVLFGLTGVAVSQPLLSSLGSQPTVFAFNGVSGSELVVFALAVAFVPPLVLWAVGSLLMWLRPSIGRAVHLFFVGALVAMAASQVCRYTIGLHIEILVGAVAVVAAGAAVWAFLRFDQARQFAAFLSPLPVLAVVLFLFASQTTPLLSVESEGSAADASRDLPPVVVLILDELPTKTLLDAHRHIDRERFPNLAHLAEDATWYRNYTTTASHTEFAVPSMLSSKRPVDGEPIYTNYPDNLFSLLEPTHDLHVYESFTKLCERADCEGAGERGASWRRLSRTTLDFLRTRADPFAGREELSMDDFEEQATRQPVERSAGDVAAAVAARQNKTVKASPTRFKRFLTTLRATDVPALDFIHLVLPHHPWRYYAHGAFVTTVPDTATYPFSRVNDQGDWVATLSEQRHILQAQYTDSLVGEMLDRLHRIGRYDDSLVVIAADHGYSFETGTPVRNVERSTLDSLAYAPLLVKLPRQTKGRIDDSNVSALDLLPTIAAGAGVKIPFRVEGLPAGDPRVARRDGAKVIANIIPSEKRRFRGQIRFTIDDTKPQVSDRWIPPKSPGTGDLAALNVAAGVTDVIGRRLDDLVTVTTGKATVRQLADHEGRTGQAAGFLTGTIDGVPDDGTVLVAFDGTIVAASPLFTLRGAQQTFAALTPEAWVGRKKSLRLAVQTPDGVTEVAVG